MHDLLFIGICMDSFDMIYEYCIYLIKFVCSDLYTKFWLFGMHDLLFVGIYKNSFEMICENFVYLINVICSYLWLFVRKILKERHIVWYAWFIICGYL